MEKPENLMIENARIMFRNFAGREQQFNSLGDRNFVVFLEPRLAEKLKAEGWNVKQLRQREEDEDEPQEYLQVAVKYGKYPPRITLISSKGRTPLDESTVEMLDYTNLKKVDLIINPSIYLVNGNEGIKAYLKTAFITLDEDELELKYAEDPTGQTPNGNSTAAEDD